MSNIQKTGNGITKFIGFLHNGPNIEPFNRDIYLISIHIAGLMYCDNIDEILLKIDKGTNLCLLREKQNYYDQSAIIVKFEDYKLGYVPKKHNIILANLMDAGKELYGVIEGISVESAVYIGEDDYVQIDFKIFMKD